MSNATSYAILITTVVMTVLSPASLHVWGRIGHRASARLAESRLTPEAAAAMRALLDPGEDLVEISSWADQQREVSDTGPWHYVNVPITESRYDAKFCQPRGCVVSKFEDFKRILLD